MNQSFVVQGMSCGHCELAVREALQQLDPQARVEIDRARQHVAVQTERPREAVAQALSALGYTVT